MTTLPTPQDVLDYWLGETIDQAETVEAKHQLWFGKSFETDKDIADRFLSLIAPLADGLAYDWAEQGPQQRLAAIITLDQFSRNLFRDSPLSFAHDRIALGLTKEALMKGEDKTLSEVERIFLYIPLEHSEAMTDQDLSVQMYNKLAESARVAFKDLCENTLDYAHRHRDVIKQFGRFPHRNQILGRPNTPEEAEYLAQPGAGF
ncbi:MAG: DUF924 family protein [Pseudomonadota bacterium]